MREIERSSNKNRGKNRKRIQYKCLKITYRTNWSTRSYPLVSAGQQGGHTLTQTVERGSLIWLIVPALHHQLITTLTQALTIRQESLQYSKKYQFVVKLNLHITGSVFRFGHPVATLDFVIEAGVHNHARIRGPACIHIHIKYKD